MAEGIEQWVCKHCGSKDLIGTLPAWFQVNTVENVSIDFEADWGYGICNACEASGAFEEVAQPEEEATENDR